jgi:hypothetical protein
VLADRQRIACTDIERSELPAGASAGIRARYLDDGSTYLLFFDEHDRLIGADGHISIAPFGEGEVHAEFADFRSTGGYVLPFAGRYLLDGAPLFDERTLSIVPNDPALSPKSFQTP